MDNQQLYKDLQALEDASFPKSCDKCGEIFQNEHEYIAKSTAYNGSSGLAQARDNQGERFVKLARRCLCGQPILDHFNDRRDTSKQGELRRMAFEKVVNDLVAKGIKREIARQELLNHMRGIESKILVEFGIFNS
ncbi:MAG: hypothetical protein OQJ89_03780 [Kangiellaceae bacterium]|nr:hypothetical protein [Kangiellaceae bacterium]MCW9016059.1 hypothetical protein [Kangiellaceae bacterium]